jgi:hypothetical protein
MKYAVHKYDQDLVIEADRFALVPGHTQTSGLTFGSGGSSNTWMDAVFYRNSQEDPVAFVHQPYSVMEVADDN